jgi:hypothetical protein
LLLRRGLSIAAPFLGLMEWLTFRYSILSRTNTPISFLNFITQYYNGSDLNFYQSGDNDDHFSSIWSDILDLFILLYSTNCVPVTSFIVSSVEMYCFIFVWAMDCILIVFGTEIRNLYCKLNHFMWLEGDRADVPDRLHVNCNF